MPLWWRIYYAGGAVFSNTDGSPYDAPRVGVQVVAQEKDGTWEMVHGRDHFYWEPELGWCTSDLIGAIDHLMRAHRQCLLFGRYVTDQEYAEVLARVNAAHGPRDHRYPREAIR